MKVLENLAQIWGVSKEEAIRRALAQARPGSVQPEKIGRFDAFKKLQGRMQLTQEKAGAWQALIVDARRWRAVR